jgi:hypothetical protein
MPVAQLTNPAAEENEGASSGVHTISAINGDTVALNPGQLVEFVTPFVAGTSQFKVKRSSTTADFLLAGVLTGSSTETSAGTIAVGAACEVIVEGHTQGLFGASTTAGDVVTQSTTTAGICLDAGTTPVLYKTIGVVLNTVTISSGTALVDMYVHKG